MRSHRGTRRLRGFLTGLLLAVVSIPLTTAYDLDPNSTESIKYVAKNLVEDLLFFYHGDEPGHIPGVLPEPPHFWWQGGALMGSLIEYWYYTKDDSYVDLAQQGLLFQTGEYNDYMPMNQTTTEGNDDQGFWAAAVMSAAEYNFPHPGGDKPSWLALAQAVFNTQVPRWDTTVCNGGLRWQIFPWNKGYDYKNTISQGTFFSLAARLALYTGNETYADWAVKTWDWMTGVGYINDKWYVSDGAHTRDNCTKINGAQYTYNAGIFILGSAAMYNFTEEAVWKERLDGLLQGAEVFMADYMYKRTVMQEIVCEGWRGCNTDQLSFKAYLSRWLATATQWAPDTYDKVIPWLRESAVAATKQCQGGYNGRMCGHQWQIGWNTGLWDGTIGAGQQMSALEVTLGCMIKHRDPILRSDNGGTSKSDPGAGTQPKSFDPMEKRYGPITMRDRLSAGFITAVIIGLFIAGICCLLVDEDRPKEEDKKTTGETNGASGAKNTTHKRPGRKPKLFWGWSGDPSIRSGEVVELGNLQAATQPAQSSVAPSRMNGAEGPGPNTRTTRRGWDWLKRGVSDYNTGSRAS